MISKDTLRWAVLGGSVTAVAVGLGVWSFVDCPASACDRAALQAQESAATVEAAPPNVEESTEPESTAKAPPELRRLQPYIKTGDALERHNEQFTIVMEPVEPNEEEKE